MSGAGLVDICGRMHERLSAPDIDRHALLDVATVLQLLADALAVHAESDVVAHSCAVEDLEVSEDALAETRQELEWVASHAQTADLETLRLHLTRAEGAARETLVHAEKRVSRNGDVTSGTAGSEAHSRRKNASGRSRNAFINET